MPNTNIIVFGGGQTRSKWREVLNKQCLTKKTLAFCMGALEIVWAGVETHFLVCDVLWVHGRARGRARRLRNLRIARGPPDPSKPPWAL